LVLVGVGAGSALAAPILTIQKLIPVPSDAANGQPGGAFTSFDISYFDPVTGNDYVADRSNASVDIFSGSSLTSLGRATGFTGQGATTSVSGADGVVMVTPSSSATEPQLGVTSTAPIKLPVKYRYELGAVGSVKR
jgi:hypothetical protein